MSHIESTSYTLFMKEMYQSLHEDETLAGLSMKETSPIISNAWAMLTKAEKEVYKARGKALSNALKEVKAKPNKEAGVSKVNVGLQITPRKIFDIDSYPIQRSLYVYDPSVVYDHSLYSSKQSSKNIETATKQVIAKDAYEHKSNDLFIGGRSVRTVVRLTDIVEDKTIHNIILKYPKAKVESESGKTEMPVDSPPRVSLRDDSLLVSDTKPDKTARLEAEIRNLLSDIKDFQVTSDGRSSLCDYVSRLLLVIQKLRIKSYPKYDYEEGLNDRGYTTFIGEVSIELNPMNVVKVKGSDVFTTKKTARQQAAYLALIELAKLKDL